MMRKTSYPTFIATLLTILLFFSLTACGNNTGSIKESPAPNGIPAVSDLNQNPKNQVTQSSPTSEKDVSPKTIPESNPGSDTGSDTASVAKTAEPSMLTSDIFLPVVEVKEDRVVCTVKDTHGNESITEYIFSGKALDKILLTSVCPDETSAKALYDSYLTGDRKDYVSILYSSITLDGDRIFCEYNRKQLEPYFSLTKEQIAAAFQQAYPSSGTNDSQTHLTLPEGFPELMDGISTLTNLGDSGFMLTWDKISGRKADMVIGYIEEWAGATTERTDTDDGFTGFIDNGLYMIDIEYHSKPYGGSTEQLAISVMSY